MRETKKKNERKVKVVKPSEKNADSQLKFSIIGVLLIVVAICLGVGTFSYYQNAITDNKSNSITTWSFLVTDQPTEFVADLGILKPGMNGHINLGLSAAENSSDVNVVVSFSGKENWPTNLKLYLDEGKTSEIIVGTTTLSRTITAGSSEIVTLYYDWPKGSGKGTNSTSSTNQATKFVITVVGTQVEQ